MAFTQNVGESLLNVLDSAIEDIVFRNTDFDSVEFTDTYSSCNSMQFVGGSLNVLKISCKTNKLIMKNLTEIVCSNEGNIELIELETISKKDLRKYERVIKNSFERYKSIVLSLYSSFDARKMFTESDLCLYEIRRLELIIKQINANIFSRIIISLKRFFAEKCFGWGINILNNLITMVGVILGFSGLYKIISALPGHESVPLGKCIEISVDRFFLVGSDDISFGYNFLGAFDTAESVIGVIMLTIITGVIVRKLIK